MERWVREFAAENGSLFFSPLRLNDRSDFVNGAIGGLDMGSVFILAFNLRIGCKKGKSVEFVGKLLSGD